MPKIKSRKFLIHNSLFTILFLVAFLERTAWNLGPNIELVTTVIILSSLYLGAQKSIFLTFLIIFASDLIIGNTNIFIFTWTGFLIPAFLSKKIINFLGKKFHSLLGTGFIVNIFFYLWTNFGVWLLDSWGMYEKTPSGLIKCYMNGLPFLKNQIISSVVFIPLLYLAIEIGIKLFKKASTEPGRLGLSKI